MRSFAQVQECKLEVMEELGRVDSAEASARFEVTGKQVVPGLSLGVGRKGPKAFELVVVTRGVTDPLLLDRTIRLASGEARVVKLGAPPRPRITSAWSKKPKKVGEIGQQVGPDDAAWVGTGSLYGRMAGTGLYAQLTNRHVVGLLSRAGRRMHQGRKPLGAFAVGSLNVPNSHGNLTDAASIALDDGYEFYPRWDHGLKGNLRKVRPPNEDDLGSPFSNTGQTVGTRYGAPTAGDLDDFPVGYDEGLVYYDNVWMLDNGFGKAFSAPGHSGAACVSLQDAAAVLHLYAGGPADGIDRTFALDMVASMMAAGMVPELLEV